MVTGGTGAAAAAHAATAKAIKASGAIVSIEPSEFRSILRKVEKPLVVTATGGFMSRSYQYLTGYKGFVFFAKSRTPLELPRDAELITARKIWAPD